MMDILVILAVFMFLVFFHELGHFIAAKSFGVYVEKFSIGFSMFGLFRPLIIKKYRETEYQIYPTLFLGGYVQMKGQDDADPTKLSDDDDSYNKKHPIKKSIIILAGPVANLLLAWALYIGIGLLGPQALSPTIGEIQPNSPASKSELQSGDVIQSINGVHLAEWSEFGKTIQRSNGAITLQIERQGESKTVVMTPQIMRSQNIFGESIEKKMVGVAPSGEVITLELGLVESVHFANAKTLEACTFIVQALGKLIEGVVPATEVGSVISIGKVISDANDVGIVAVLVITALISVNLGIINLLPIPALDGGHLMFNLYEMIFQKAPSLGVVNALTMFGWAILFSLMALGMYNDINRFFG